MQTRPPFAPSLALAMACASLLGACSQESPPPPAGDTAAQAEDTGFIARTTRRAVESARRDLAEGNISIGGADSGGVNVNGFRFGGEDGRTSHLPKAEISPTGELLIGGTPIELDAAQRQQVLAYRASIVAIAESGIEIGLQGAQLGAQAAKGAIASALSGGGEAFEQRMQAGAEQIKAQAYQLCDRLPALYEAQQALAGTLPAFAPYATMDATAAEDCRKDVRSEDTPASEADAAADTTTG